MLDIKIVLASKSPRRQSLIGELGFPVEIRLKEIDEIYPASIDVYNVPSYLSKLKAEPFKNDLIPGEVLLTSDTVVVYEGRILGKPKNERDAFEMLRSLSGKMHEVVTGVCLMSTKKKSVFSTRTRVFFSCLSDDEIEYYIAKFKPMDKAGSYGIQEWIGYIGVERIEGCYYNVMGLPLHDVYATLKKDFI